MTRKSTKAEAAGKARAGEERDALYTAHEVHAIAQLIVRHLRSEWQAGWAPAGSAFADPTAAAGRPQCGPPWCGIPAPGARPQATQPDPSTMPYWYP